WMLDMDMVEAVIQLPTDEFFNTGIYTYLWVLNKNKKPNQKDKVMLINASEKFKQLKKSKGSKRKEIDKASRLEIVETLGKFEDNEYARVFEKEFFYFNKQAIMLTNVDEQGKFLSETIKLSPTKLENGQRTLTEFVVDTVPTLAPHASAGEVSLDSTVDRSNLRDVPLQEYIEAEIKPFMASLDYKEQPMVITTATAKYYYDTEQETLIEESKGKKKSLGCGKIAVKAAYKNKRQAERIEITVELTPDTEKDYEIIPFHKDETQNQAAIADFMAKYVTKPFEYLENVVGVEINFNKIFYKPETIREISQIKNEIQSIENELKILETALLL
ncbi:MAG: N-6 DNA methylase, partial [Anaerolineales bacterium]